MGSPITLPHGVERYINVAKRGAPGGGTRGLLAGQARHLMTSYANLSGPLEHDTEVLAALSDERCPLTEEQRQRLPRQIPNIMDAIASSTARTTRDKQIHMHLENYLPDCLWSRLCDPMITIDDKLQDLAHFLVDTLGCLNPDAPTKGHATVIPPMASGFLPSPKVAYANARDFSEKGGHEERHP